MYAQNDAAPVMPYDPLSPDTVYDGDRNIWVPARGDATPYWAVAIRPGVEHPPNGSRTPDLKWTSYRVSTRPDLVGAFEIDGVPSPNVRVWGGPGVYGQVVIPSANPYDGILNRDGKLPFETLKVFRVHTISHDVLWWLIQSHEAKTRSP